MWSGSWPASPAVSKLSTLHVHVSYVEVVDVYVESIQYVPLGTFEYTIV